MSEEELRKEAVRRRQSGESAEEVAAALDRTSRWVRKWTVRATEEVAGWVSTQVELADLGRQRSG